jgi:hypothetical protein
LYQTAQATKRPVAQLRIADMTTVTLPLSGRMVSVAKVEDAQTGEVYGVAMDADGAYLTLDAARQLWRDEHAARYGRLQPDLLDRLQTMKDEERLVVALWLKADIQPQARPAMNHTPNTGHESGAPETVRPAAQQTAPAGEREERSGALGA